MTSVSRMSIPPTASSSKNPVFLENIFWDEELMKCVFKYDEQLLGNLHFEHDALLMGEKY